MFEPRAFEGLFLAIFICLLLSSLLKVARIVLKIPAKVDKILEGCQYGLVFLSVVILVGMIIASKYL
jgi:hypothetical protein